MYYMPYHEKDRRNSLEVFGRLSGKQSDTDVHIAKELGTGTLQIINLEEGIYVRIWDCTFDQRIQVNRLSDQNAEQVFFTLVYYLTPESVDLVSKKEPDIKVNKLWNTVFLSSNAEFSLDILPGKPMKCFSICFTPGWLQGHNINDRKLNEFISKMLKAVHPVFFFESYNAVEEKMVRDIYDHSSARQLNSLFIRSRVWAIVNEFITKASARQSLLAPVNVDIHEYSIRQVEARLVNYLDSSLPRLKELAREFALSESTLKRNFKRTYGKSVNNYYLDKKMAYAKELIQKNKTVTEAAYILGYEKVSHFIYMFKKHIGCLPGSFRRGMVTGSGSFTCSMSNIVDQNSI